MWFVPGLINFVQQKDPTRSLSRPLLGRLVGMILAECHALLGPINPGDQISDTWGMAPAADQLWDSTIRAHSGGTSQTGTLLLRSITNMHWPRTCSCLQMADTQSLYFLTLSCYYVHVSLMTVNSLLIRLTVHCNGCARHMRYSRSEMAVAPEGEKGVGHPTLCVHIFNQCSHCNCLCNKLWPAAGVWYRPTNILLMDYVMQAQRDNIVYQNRWRFSKLRMNCTIPYPL